MQYVHHVPPFAMTSSKAAEYTSCLRLPGGTQHFSYRQQSSWTWITRLECTRHGRRQCSGFKSYSCMDIFPTYINWTHNVEVVLFCASIISSIKLLKVFNRISYWKFIGMDLR